MNTRTCKVIAVLTLMSFYSGCCSSRNFMAGRGARCGSPNTTPAPSYGAPQAPCAQNQAPYQTGTADCGCNNYTGSNVYSGQVYSNGSCGCGYEGYGTVVTDPYMSGEIIGESTMPFQGQVIQQGVAPVQSDDFSARRFDSDGSRILWEAPLPKGATAL
jgi:hypothetical protein